VQVVTPGKYFFAAIYRSTFVSGVEADFSVSVGTHHQIHNMAAATTGVTLPALRSGMVRWQL
jgi:hypothetical protein